MRFPAQLTWLSERWEQQSPQWRQRFIIISGLSLVVLIGLLYIAFRPNYVTVFHGLTLEDAAAITQELESKRITTKLESGGTAIAVPRKQADVARLEAATAGLPRSGRVGYDLINKSGFSMTESERALQQQLILEDQLALTLEKISGIVDAEVKLALPKENIFLDPKRQTEPTASIWVKANRTLDSGQVAGLVHLVSRSVPNLSPDNVTVIDAEGRVLNSGISHGGIGFPDQQARQAALQLELERSINTLLGTIFGEENVAVRVVAELDFNEHSTETVRFESPEDGEGGLVRHLEELSELYSGEGSCGGAPGTDSNPGEVLQTPDGGGSSSESEKRHKAITYELDEIRETIVYAPGAIKRLSVSVIVNETESVIDTAGIEAAVRAAVGYDSVRSDVVSVQTMSFARGDGMGPSVPPTPWYAAWGARIGIGAALLVVLFVGFRAFARRRQLQEIQQLQAAQLAAAAQAQTTQEFADPEDDETERLRKHLARVARQKPNDFAVLIRAWLNEEG